MGDGLRPGQTQKPVGNRYNQNQPQPLLATYQNLINFSLPINKQTKQKIEKNGPKRNPKKPIHHSLRRLSAEKSPTADERRVNIHEIGPPGSIGNQI